MAGNKVGKKRQLALHALDDRFAIEVDENDYTVPKKAQQWNERMQRSSSPAQLGPIWLKRPLYHDSVDMAR